MAKNASLGSWSNYKEDELSRTACTAKLADNALSTNEIILVPEHETHWPELANFFLFEFFFSGETFIILTGGKRNEKSVLAGARVCKNAALLPLRVRTATLCAATRAASSKNEYVETDGLNFTRPRGCCII